MYILLTTIIVSAKDNVQNKLNKFPVEIVSIYDNKINTIFSQKYKACVYLFIAPECPICLNYIPTIKKINSYCNENNCKLLLVFSGKTYSKKELQLLDTKYKLQTTFIYDDNYTLRNYFGAQVTPHSFLTNKLNQVVYKGLIDNKSLEIGMHNETASIFYLKNNLLDFINNKPLRHINNEAVGCIIE